MHRRTPLSVLLAAATRALILPLAFATACARPVPLPEEVPADVDPHEAWARFLREHVDEHGAIDLEILQQEPQDLEVFVAWVGTYSPVATPERFPEKADKLAYYVNAWNALCLYNVLYGAEPDYGVDFYQLRSLPMGGGHVTLEGLREVIRRLNDPRVCVAMTSCRRTDPRLRREPYRAETIDGQLDEAVREFVNDPERVRVLGRGTVVRLSPVLKEERQAIERQAPLLAWVNRFREKPIPREARVEFLPADARLRTVSAEER